MTTAVYWICEFKETNRHECFFRLQEMEINGRGEYIRSEMGSTDTKLVSLPEFGYDGEVYHLSRLKFTNVTKMHEKSRLGRLI